MLHSACLNVAHASIELAKTLVSATHCRWCKHRTTESARRLDTAATTPTLLLIKQQWAVDAPGEVLSVTSRRSPWLPSQRHLCHRRNGSPALSGSVQRSCRAGQTARNSAKRSMCAGSMLHESFRLRSRRRPVRSKRARIELITLHHARPQACTLQHNVVLACCIAQPRTASIVSQHGASWRPGCGASRTVDTWARLPAYSRRHVRAGKPRWSTVGELKNVVLSREGSAVFASCATFLILLDSLDTEQRRACHGDHDMSPLLCV